MIVALRQVSDNYQAIINSEKFVFHFAVTRVAPAALQPDVRGGAAGLGVLHRQRDAPCHIAHRKTSRCKWLTE